jgi:hypothetical protein
MTDQTFLQQLIWARLHIRVDPPPPWAAKLTKEQMAQFNEVQTRLNAKILELETEKIEKLFKIVGTGVA